MSFPFWKVSDNNVTLIPLSKEMLEKFQEEKNRTIEKHKERKLILQDIENEYNKKISLVKVPFDEQLKQLEYEYIQNCKRVQELQSQSTEILYKEQSDKESIVLKDPLMIENLDKLEAFQTVENQYDILLALHQEENKNKWIAALEIDEEDEECPWSIEDDTITSFRSIIYVEARSVKPLSSAVTDSIDLKYELDEIDWKPDMDSIQLIYQDKKIDFSHPYIKCLFSMDKLEEMLVEELNDNFNGSVEIECDDWDSPQYALRKCKLFHIWLYAWKNTSFLY